MTWSLLVQRSGWKEGSTSCLPFHGAGVTSWSLSLLVASGSRCKKTGFQPFWLSLTPPSWSSRTQLDSVNWFEKRPESPHLIFGDVFVKLGEEADDVFVARQLVLLFLEPPQVVLVRHQFKGVQHIYICWVRVSLVFNFTICNWKPFWEDCLQHLKNFWEENSAVRTPLLTKILNCCHLLAKLILPSMRSGLPIWTNVRSWERDSDLNNCKKTVSYKNKYIYIFTSLVLCFYIFVHHFTLVCNHFMMMNW